MDVDIEGTEDEHLTDLDPDDCDVYRPEKKKFKPNDFDEKCYYKEVYKIIVNEMDKREHLHKLDTLNFLRKYRKELKSKQYTKPDPFFDAWQCVFGRRRKEFNPRQLVKYYPGVKKHIKKVREICHVTIQETDGSDGSDNER